MVPRVGVRPKTRPPGTSDELNFGDRVLGEVEKSSFIALPGKGGHSKLVPRKPVCVPTWEDLVRRFCLFVCLFCFLFRPLLAILKFPDQGSNPCPLQWKRGVLTTGLPVNSLVRRFIAMVQGQVC